jgi:hypothetical protein
MNRIQDIQHKLDQLEFATMPAELKRQTRIQLLLDLDAARRTNDFDFDGLIEDARHDDLAAWEQHDDDEYDRQWSTALSRWQNGVGLPVVTLLWFGAMVLIVGWLG